MEELATEHLVSQVSFKKRTAKAKANVRKRAESPPRISSDSEPEYTSSENEEGHRIKRRRKIATVTASSAIPVASRNDATEEPAQQRILPSSAVNDATKHSNWHDNVDLSPENLLGKTRARPPPSNTDDTGPEGDGRYRGAANYQSFVKKNPNAPTKQFGPMKAATNIRTITITDFAPDVCKDYKQTGFCGFGDSCKFLHAREDYKQGWELDRDWEIGTKGKKLSGRTMASANRALKSSGSSNEADDTDEDEAELFESIPFACIICKKPYSNPVVTKCGHYFCEACALQRYRKNPSCAACGSGTGGVFNVAKKLNKLLERKRERARKRREKAFQHGEEVNDEHEGDIQEE